MFRLVFFIILVAQQLHAQSTNPPPFLAGIKTGQQIYLDAKIQAVFDNPGYNYKTCKEDSACKRRAYPTRDSEVFYEGYTRVETVKNLNLNVDVQQYYIYVRVRVWKAEENKWVDEYGWTTADAFKMKHFESAFKTKTETPAAKENCPPVLQPIKKEHVEVGHNQTIEDVVKEIGPWMGVCPVKNPQKVRTEFKPGEVPFDELILPNLEKEKEKFPKVLNEDRKPATADDFYAIDASARTCFAEIGTCALAGPEYIFAWQAMVLNREKYVTQDSANKSRFEPTKRIIKSETDLEKIPTDPSQYVVWKNPHGTGQALCPPSNPDKAFYDLKVTRKPLPPESEIWNTCLRVATEAILYPKYFEAKRTPNFKDVFYIVGENKSKMTTATPSILGRPLSNPRCMNVLRDRTLGPLKD